MDTKEGDESKYTGLDGIKVLIKFFFFLMKQALPQKLKWGVDTKGLVL